MVTKEDLIRTEERILFATKENMAQTEVHIIKWVAGMLVAQAIVVATLVKLL